MQIGRNQLPESSSFYNPYLANIVIYKNFKLKKHPPTFKKLTGSEII